MIWVSIPSAQSHAPLNHTPIQKGPADCRKWNILSQYAGQGMSRDTQDRVTWHHVKSRTDQALWKPLLLLGSVILLMYCIEKVSVSPGLFLQRKSKPGLLDLPGNNLEITPAVCRKSQLAQNLAGVYICITSGKVRLIFLADYCPRRTLSAERTKKVSPRRTLSATN